jgi:hypothetical protein
MGIRNVTPQTRQGSGHDWDDARKAALFADIVSLKLSIDEAAALHGLRVDVIQEWLRQFRRSALVAFDERLKKTLIDQGANADALTAAEFTGHVEEVSIADLLQTIEIAGKDAVITVTHEGADSRMWCSAGAIIDAESGRLNGDAAVYRILAFERGRMVADLRPEQRTRTIYAATHRLLLEAMRRKDEAAQLERKLGNVNRPYRLGERSTMSRVRVTTNELSILRLFDGPRRLRDVLAQSHIGDLESLTALVRLVEDGYLVENDAAPQPPRPANDVHTQRAAPGPLIRTERLDAARRSEASTLPPLAQRMRKDAGEARSAGGRSDSARRVDLGDGSQAGTSFAPFSVPQRPERKPLRWALAALGLMVLAPAGFWFGEAISNVRPARHAHAGNLQSRTAALDVAPTFSVATRVEPSSAELWLDRHPVATGQLGIVLPKDGSTHQLRVAADGYIPITLMFADVPPPRLIRLEALPEPPAAPHEPPIDDGTAMGRVTE